MPPFQNYNILALEAAVRLGREAFDSLWRRALLDLLCDFEGVALLAIPEFSYKIGSSIGLRKEILPL